MAFDNERGDWRTFRADRIQNVQPTGIRTPPREVPGGDPAAFVTSKLYESAPTYRAVATLHIPYELVVGRLGDSPGDLVPIDEHSCRLNGHTDTLEWLGFRLAMLGCEFEIHEPPELAEYLRKLGARLIRAADGDLRRPAPTRGRRR